MEIEFKYEVDGDAAGAFFSNVEVNVDYSNSQIVLTFPVIAENYDSLYANMQTDPTDIEIKFDSFGQSLDYSNLKVINTNYMRNVNPSTTRTKLVVTLEYI